VSRGDLVLVASFAVVRCRLSKVLVPPAIQVTELITESKENPNKFSALRFKVFRVSQPSWCLQWSDGSARES
jgi:hypothetical protein